MLAPVGGGADEQLRFGMLVWSAGLQQVNFVRNLYSAQYEIRKAQTGRLLVDDYLRVQANMIRGQDCPMAASGPFDGPTHGL